MKLIREVTIHFLSIDPTTWVAYIEDMPAVNYQANDIKTALRGVLAELSGLDRAQYSPKNLPVNKYTIRLTIGNRVSS